MKKPKKNIRKRHYRMSARQWAELKEREAAYKRPLLSAGLIGAVASMEDRRD
jgi:hypothetical protein